MWETALRPVRGRSSKGVLAKAKALGLAATFACELEFFIFKETSESLTQKGFRGLSPLSPGMFGYSWVREGQNNELCHAIPRRHGGVRTFSIEGLHTETGPGVYEVAIRYDDAIRMADKAALFKTAMKQISFASSEISAARSCRSGTRSSRVERAPASVALERGRERLLRRGRSELVERCGEELPRRPGRADARAHGALRADGERLQTLRPGRVGAAHRVVGGRESHLRDSDDRGGSEGHPARISADRGRHQSVHRDCDLPRGGAHPTASEKKLTPPAPASGDASRGEAGFAPLPRTLRDANFALAQSKAAKEILGEAFVDHYVRTRDWENAPVRARGLRLGAEEVLSKRSRMLIASFAIHCYEPSSRGRRPRDLREVGSLRFLVTLRATRNDDKGKGGEQAMNVRRDGGGRSQIVVASRWSPGS